MDTIQAEVSIGKPSSAVQRLITEAISLLSPERTRWTISPEHDAIFIGAPTRFGRMPSQIASFLHQAGGLWVRGALNGQLGGAFASTVTLHGEQAALFSIVTNLLHFHQRLHSYAATAASGRPHHALVS